MIRALYGVALDSPLGAEFSCSGRFASHCLEQGIWQHKAARFAIDLWLRTEAVANRFAMGQIWRPATPSGGTRATLRDAVQQVVLALITSLSAHEAFWPSAESAGPLPTWGTEPEAAPPAPAWDHSGVGEQARHDIAEIMPLLDRVLDATLLARFAEEVASPDPPLDDDLWVRIAYAFAAAARRGATAVEHLAGLFVPIYLWRAARFVAQTTSEAETTVRARLEMLGQTFELLKPVLVDEWLTGV
jgi:hypothetical protein